MIRFISNNKSLVQKVLASLSDTDKLEVIYGDIRRYIGLESVVVTASNRSFNPAGGLDLVLATYLPRFAALFKEASKTGHNQRIDNLVFVVTMSDRYDRTETLVKEALDFVAKNTKPEEDVLISGLGTGIAGLPEDKFVELFKEFTHGF